MGLSRTGAGRGGSVAARRPRPPYTAKVGERVGGERDWERAPEGLSSEDVTTAVE
jgi:hypothetical protein